MVTINSIEVSTTEASVLVVKVEVEGVEYSADVVVEAGLDCLHPQTEALAAALHELAHKLDDAHKGMHVKDAMDKIRGEEEVLHLDSPLDFRDKPRPANK